MSDEFDPTVKAEWVKRLRSGAYKQGFGYLRNTDDSYCCLGVLCEIAVEQGIIPEPKQYPGMAWGYVDTSQGDSARFGGPPKAVYRWAVGWPEGANSWRPTWVSRLIDMNDDEKKSFNQIAEYIEENL